MSVRTPYETEAEEYVLGCALTSRDAAAELVRLVEPEDFFDPKHQAVFSALRSLLTAGKGIDPVLVKDRLRQDGAIADHDTILDCIHRAGSQMFLKDHAELIVHRARAREVSRLSSDPHTLSSDELRDNTERLAALTARMQKLEESRPTTDVAKMVNADLAAMEGDPERGIPSGFASLDDKTLGFFPGDLVVVGAESGHGKTNLLLRFAVNAAKQGHKVLFFSLEMMAQQLRNRIYAAETSIGLHAIRTRALGKPEWAKLTDVAAKVQTWSLRIHDTRNMTAEDIAAEVRRVNGTWGVDMIVVDYLQEVRATSTKGNRYEQIGEIARSLKGLAGALEVPVLTASQLNKRNLDRTDKRPRMGDLRESADIEHTADLVMFLYWAYKHTGESAENAEILVRKNRQGESEFGVNVRYNAAACQLYESRYMFGGDGS